MAKKKTTYTDTTKKNTAAAAEKEAATDMVKGSKAMAFRKINYILLLVGVAAIILGFLLIVGDSSTTEAYNPDIFSARRTKVAPMVCLAGFLFMIVAILYHKKPAQTTDSTPKDAEA